MNLKKMPFIVFEGIDGSGKSTQLELLSRKLTELGIDNVCQAEPTGGEIGKFIRKILSGSEKVDPKTMALLFAADRIEHITSPNGILESVNNGKAVLSDRYYFSSYAYQMVDMPLDWVIEINKQASEIARPDLHIFVDVSPETCLDRISKGRDSTEIFENKNRLTQARENFLTIFEKTKNEENIAIIDGNKSVEEVAEDIFKEVKKYL